VTALSKRLLFKYSLSTRTGAVGYISITAVTQPKTAVAVAIGVDEMRWVHAVSSKPSEVHLFESPSLLTRPASKAYYFNLKTL